MNTHFLKCSLQALLLMVCTPLMAASCSNDNKETTGSAEPQVIIATNYMPADGSRDVTADIQRLIDSHPNRTIYFPDGVYKVSQSILTPADPHRSVMLELANFARLQACGKWAGGGAVVRLGASHPANDINKPGSNYEHRRPCKARCQQRIVGCRRKQREHRRNEHDKFHRTAHRGLRQHLHQHANSQRECGSNDKECGQYAAQHSSALHQWREAGLRIDTRIRGRTVEQLARLLLQRHVRQGVLSGQGHIGKPDELLHLLVHRLRQTGSGNMV